MKNCTEMVSEFSVRVTTGSKIDKNLLSGLSADTRLAGMLWTTDYDTVNNVFHFLGAIVNELCGLDGNAIITSRFITQLLIALWTLYIDAFSALVEAIWSFRLRKQYCSVQAFRCEMFSAVSAFRNENAEMALCQSRLECHKVAWKHRVSTHKIIGKSAWTLQSKVYKYFKARLLSNRCSCQVCQHRFAICKRNCADPKNTNNASKSLGFKNQKRHLVKGNLRITLNELEMYLELRHNP